MTSKSNSSVENVTESADNVEAKVEEPVKEEEVTEEQPVVEEPPAEEKQELAIEDKGKATKEQIAEVKLGKFLTVKQVATSLGFSTAYVSYLLKGDKRKGIPPRIHGVKVLGGSWRIPESEYERLIKEGPLPLKKPDEEKQVTKIKVEAEEVVDTPDEKVKETKAKIGKAEAKPAKWPSFRFDFLSNK